MKLEDYVRKASWQDKGATFFEDNIICPYCGYVEEDSYDFTVGEHNNVECPECGRKYDVTVELRKDFSTCRSICEMPEDYIADDYQDLLEEENND